MYQRILVPVDGSDASTIGVDEAIRLARLTKGQVRFLHVIDELSFALAMDHYSGFAGDWRAVLREDGNKFLESAKASARSAAVDAQAVLHDSYQDKLAEVVAKEATQWPADLIVLGTHGRRGVRRFFLGSGAESVLRSAPVPVLLVRATEPSAVEAPQATTASLPSAALSME